MCCMSHTACCAGGLWSKRSLIAATVLASNQRNIFSHVTRGDTDCSACKHRPLLHPASACCSSAICFAAVCDVIPAAVAERLFDNERGVLYGCVRVSEALAMKQLDKATADADQWTRPTADGAAVGQALACRLQEIRGLSGAVGGQPAR